MLPDYDWWPLYPVHSPLDVYMSRVMDLQRPFFSNELGVCASLLLAVTVTVTQKVEHVTATALYTIWVTRVSNPVAVPSAQNRRLPGATLPPHGA